MWWSPVIKFDIELIDIIKFMNSNKAKDTSEILSQISNENLEVGNDYCKRLHKKCIEDGRDYFMYFGDIGNTYSKYILYCDKKYNLYCMTLSLSKENGIKIIDYCSIENASMKQT